MCSSDLLLSSFSSLVEERTGELAKKTGQEIDERFRVLDQLQKEGEFLKSRIEESIRQWSERAENLSKSLDESNASLSEKIRKEWAGIWEEEYKKLAQGNEERWGKWEGKSLEKMEANVEKLQDTLKREFEKLSQYLQNMKAKDTSQTQSLKKMEKGILQKIAFLEQERKLSAHSVPQGVFWTFIALLGGISGTGLLLAIYLFVKLAT